MNKSLGITKIQVQKCVLCADTPTHYIAYKDRNDGELDNYGRIMPSASGLSCNKHIWQVTAIVLTRAGITQPEVDAL